MTLLPSFPQPGSLLLTFLQDLVFTHPLLLSWIQPGGREEALPNLPPWLQQRGGLRAEGSLTQITGAGGAVLGPPDAQQRPGFMDLHVTHGAVLVGLQVAHDAGFADLGVWREGGVRAPL